MLWGNKDNAANSDIAAVMQYNKATNSTNRTNLYGNTTANVWVQGQTVGQFAVDTQEAQANPSIPHSGWVLRKEGTGLRAGRVTYEVLVATGSIATDGSDDTTIPDYTLTVTLNPISNSTNVIQNVNFTVAATSLPTGATVSYQWQRWTGSAWANIANTAGAWYKVTSPTLIANNLVANANTIRAAVSATGATTVYSANATITLTA